MTTLTIERTEVGQTAEFIGIRAGCIGMVMGVDDWNVSRLDEAPMMVLYVFESRKDAQSRLEGLRTVNGLSEAEIDAYFHVKHTVTMGEGERPPTLLSPIKILIPAPHGFAKNPMQTFDRAVQIYQAGLWHLKPEIRQRPKPGSVGRGGGEGAPGEPKDIPENFEADAVLVESPFEPRLPSARRIDYDGVRGYTAPSFQVPVQGHYRKIKPNAYGPDKDGNLIKGKRWIDDHTRFSDKPVKVEQPKKPKNRASIAAGTSEP